MSEAKIFDLEFAYGKNLVDLDFTSLKNYLESRLEQVQSSPDLEKLAILLSSLLRSERFPNEQIAFLKRFRQRIYDRRRHQKLNSQPETVASTKPRTQIKQPNYMIKNLAIYQNQPTKNFMDGVNRAFLSIDSERLIKNAPRFIVWFFAACLVSFFLWQQSLDLYQSAGFSKTVHSAAGGILMVVGFAAYYSLTKSWLALFFCLYAVSYEGYLMISGTIHNEKQTLLQSVQNTPELSFLSENASKEHDRYLELKKRYDDPESKVFKNEWFLKNHLDPAWNESLMAHNEYMAKKAILVAGSNTGHVTWLKIFYRLGLVFLCMLFIHRFFAVFLIG